LKKQETSEAKMKKALSGPNDAATILHRAGIVLTQDEALVATPPIHGAIFWKGAAVVIAGLLLLLTLFQNLGFFLIFVGLLMLGLAYMTRRYLILAATNKRVFVRSGILYADMIELRYSQIESVEVGITPIGQAFGYGNVIVTGTGQRRIIVPFITDALRFRSMVNDILVKKE
jgi:membrane protein YdbS with pleckstrin-like domain